MPFRFVVVGDASLTVECAELLRSRGHDIVACVSDAPPVAGFASQHGIPLVPPGTAPWPTCDYLLSIVNLRMLSTSEIAAPLRAAINFHDGPLPRFAGLNAPVWAILEGAAEFGVTWHMMTAEADAGGILEQECFPLDPAETAVSLNTRCFEAGLTSFQRLLTKIEDGTLHAREQNLTERTYYGLKSRPAGGGIIDPFGPIEEALRLVRALDFGPYENPIGTARVIGPTGAVSVGRAVRSPSPVHGAGRLTAIRQDSLLVELSDGAVELLALTDADGCVLSGAEAATELGLLEGEQLPLIDLPAARELASAAARSEASWSRSLRAAEALELPLLTPTHTGASAAEVVSEWMSRPELLSQSFSAFVSGLAAAQPYVAWFASEDRVVQSKGMEAAFDPFVPVAIPANCTREDLRRVFGAAGSQPPMPRDLRARIPELRSTHRAGDQVGFAEQGCIARNPSFDLLLTRDSESSTLRWSYSPARFSRRDIELLAEAFQSFHEQFVSDGSAEPEAIDLPSTMQLARFGAWNDTAVPFDATVTVSQLFEEAAAIHPKRVALRGGAEEMTYAELNARANTLAQKLVEHGVGPDSLVAVHLPRSYELVVALLAIHKAGGAYVPIDPEYPRQRKDLMIADSGATVVVAARASRLSAPGTREILLEQVQCGEPENLGRRSSGQHLAYVIYTSGSTGCPKGVMVEHRNAVNFFLAMDERIGRNPGVWLAVTSMSFDISVLELLWTLTRGFTVVVQSASEIAAPAGPSLSLYFFASQTGEEDSPYGLLLEASRFADKEGFEAVWLPERHFHAFGGAFPNPSVAAAAVAATTSRIQVRAGSCVLPLHSPLRVAEEWSMVDQLSGGRAGVSFAAGWQPRDFVLKPEAFGSGKDVLERDIRLVQRLWRGEPAELVGHDGAPIAVSTLPRPRQRELPTWLTSAGDPETFRMAGRMGTGILTHLIGQSVEDLAEKLAVYRLAWAEAGHPGDGHVTLMLHAFVHEDAAAAREAVREPLIAYLASSVGLIRNFASSFPAFKRLPEGESADELLQSLSPEDLRELLEIAFERYYESSGLFGTPERAAEVLRSVAAVGVDEVACLVDFGVPHEQAMQSLQLVAGLSIRRERRDGASIAQNIRAHGVTHFQCTPSMAAMLAADDDALTALSELKVMLIGGEAFPSELASTLRSRLRGRLLNMYGPTETTVWSTTSDVIAPERGVSIGTPIANTLVTIRNNRGQLLPEGCTGELCIGGDGVTRGYHERPDLTADRFIRDPRTGSRYYRTGDLARWASDGSLEFLGRLDQQVKVRGYRIEPGEVESVVRSVAGVADAVVVAREDEPGDQRLVCYYVGSAPERDLRSAVAARLPAHMVPTNFVGLAALPLTPNKKIDRKALPSPSEAAVVPVPPSVETPLEPRPGGPVQNEVVDFVTHTWTQVLKSASVEKDRTFFDCGGNSLLLLQVHRRLSERSPDLRLTDLFRYPTINAMAAHLSSNASSTVLLDDVTIRAQARRAAAGRRPTQV